MSVITAFKGRPPHILTGDITQRMSSAKQGGNSLKEAVAIGAMHALGARPGDAAKLSDSLITYQKGEHTTGDRIRWAGDVLKGAAGLGIVGNFLTQFLRACEFHNLNPVKTILDMRGTCTP